MPSGYQVPLGIEAAQITKIETISAQGRAGTRKRVLYGGRRGFQRSGRNRRGWRLSESNANQNRYSQENIDQETQYISSYAPHQRYRISEFCLASDQG